MPTVADVSLAERPDPGTPRRVVVAGAGLAGLTAALFLRDAGWDVVVLEARERAAASTACRLRPGCTRSSVVSRSTTATSVCSAC
jgi:2-polyprenyl-6-methoxyphenol hydroxylase-like FAD-dependent oxidoreductase